MHIKELYSKALDEINKSVQAKNYDYCAAGVQIQDKSFRITVEPFANFENHKEIYSFEDKNNSSDIYVKVAQWEKKSDELCRLDFKFKRND